MRQVRQTILSILGIICMAGVASCAGVSEQADPGFMYKNLPIASGSAEAGEPNSVTFKGSPLALAGPGIKVGDTLRNVQVAKSDLSLINIADTKGKVRILNIVPSLDTVVCEQQTHHLSEKNKGLDKVVELITISVDTPFAQGRFAKEAGIKNVTFLSDYRGGDFGKTYGLLVKDLHLLARTVMVVDKFNIIRYMQITPELGNMPDMDAAFRTAKSLAD